MVTWQQQQQQEQQAQPQQQQQQRGRVRCVRVVTGHHDTLFLKSSTAQHSIAGLAWRGCLSQLVLPLLMLCCCPYQQYTRQHTRHLSKVMLHMIIQKGQYIILSQSS
jgi:hypothetical protein